MHNKNAKSCTIKLLKSAQQNCRKMHNSIAKILKMGYTKYKIIIIFTSIRKEIIYEINQKRI